MRDPIALPESEDKLTAVIGNAPPSPTWPVYGWAAVWILWLLFLVFMIMQR